MNRTMIVALLVVTMALLLSAGTVLAKNITCTGGTCVGTRKADNMQGKFDNDTIFGRRGNDEIIDTGPGPDVDTIFGDKGDDTIRVNEGDSDVDPDFVDCGPGIDTVFVDPTDTRLNCEILNPN